MRLLSVHRIRKTGGVCFLLQKLPFAIDPPPIAREIAISADGPVTGDHDGCGIAGAGSRHRPDSLSFDRKDYELLNIVNALDLTYFWTYQPRSRDVLRRLMRQMNPEDRRVFLLCQSVLQREREISQLFLDGLVGKNFSRALSFYLARWRSYLDDLNRMDSRLAAAEVKSSLQDETRLGG